MKTMTRTMTTTMIIIIINVFIMCKNSTNVIKGAVIQNTIDTKLDN